MDAPSDRTAIDPTRESFKQLFQRVPAEGPVVMLNLLAFREQATDGRRTGRQAYADYSKAVAPLLAAVGGRLQWFGEAHHALIAPSDE